jgi:hypothetical protein
VGECKIGEEDLITFQWGSPHVDLFATSLNYKLQVFVSPVPDPNAYAVDAMGFPWEGEQQTCSVDGTGNETVQEEPPSFLGN